MSRSTTHELVRVRKGEVEAMRAALEAARTWFLSSGEKMTARDAEIADQIDAALGHQQQAQEPK